MNVLVRTGVSWAGSPRMPLLIFSARLTSAHVRAVSAASWFRLAAEFRCEPLERAARGFPDLPGHFE